MTAGASVRPVPCPFCTGVVLFDDAKHQVRHTEPPCERFDRMCAHFNLKPTKVEPAAWQVGADGRAHEIPRGKA